MANERHTPVQFLQFLSVQQFDGDQVIRNFELTTKFQTPIPEVGERTSYGPSNGDGDDGKAIIGEVSKIQKTNEIVGDTLNIRYVIDII